VIAILGASGYVGGSLARRLLQVRDEPLVFFSRKPEGFDRAAWPRHVSFASADAFRGERFDLVINAIGAGDPSDVSSLGAALVELTDRWDNAVLTGMRPGARYVFLSSGAIYGSFERPPCETSTISLPVNELGSVPPYTLAKLLAEARHRHAPDRAILDVRIFGYADAGIPINGTSFLSELSRSIATASPFMTTRNDMVRDYAGAAELADLITAWERTGAPNMAADLYTAAPVSKTQILAAAAKRYAIDIVYSDALRSSPTGPKVSYASSFRAAEALGYRPRRESLSIVLDTLDRVRAAFRGTAMC
jgi:nucleoside-diphosphate-sugar epimerase